MNIAKDVALAPIVVLMMLYSIMKKKTDISSVTYVSPEMANPCVLNFVR